MRNPRKVSLAVVFLGAATLTAQTTSTPCPLRFRIALSKEVAAKPLGGRLFVLMSGSPKDESVLRTSFTPGGTWIAAMEVESFAPGEVIEFDPDLKAYPKPFSKAKPGSYQFMALFDQDHSYALTGQDNDDLFGPVVRVNDLDPANGAAVELVLSKRTEAGPVPAETPNIRRVEFQSPLLSAFWGRPITMRAGVVLPSSYNKAPKRRYPTVYGVHGFGQNRSEAWQRGPGLVKAMSKRKLPQMVYIFLDGSFPTGHHEFADSVNNGPWGRALTDEFIPYLEKHFPLIARPSARFLTGHSSGGWSTLWMQITYPEFFGGAWSTSPDPVDLRSFTGADVTPGSTDNAYRTAEGKPRNIAREGAKELASFEDFAKQEDVQGDYGGQLASFEWVWSPKGPGGRPMRLFNRETGELDPEVKKAWQKYDIRLILGKNWAALGPKLKGKIHVFCGSEDTFHLEEAVVMLCDFFKQKHSDAICEIIPGRDHMNLYNPYETYPEGLGERIAKEMQKAFESHLPSRAH